MQIGAVGYSIIVGNIIGSIRDQGQKELEKREKLKYMRKLGKLLEMPVEFRNTINGMLTSEIEDPEEMVTDFLKTLPLHMRGELSYQYHEQLIS